MLRKLTSEQKEIRAILSNWVPAWTPKNLPENCPMLPVNTYQDLATLNAYLETEDNFKKVVSKVFNFFMACKFCTLN